MASTMFLQQWEALSALLTSIISVIGLIVLCRHFVSEQIAIKIQFLAILSVLMLSIVSFPIWSLINNALFPSINDYLQTITPKGCNILIPASNASMVLLTFSITLFWVSTLRYFDNFLTKWQYYGWIVIHIIIQSGIFMVDLLSAPHNKRAIVVYAIDNLKAVKCVKAFDVTYIVIIFVIQGVIQLILLLIWYHHKCPKSTEENEIHQTDTTQNPHSYLFYTKKDRNKELHKKLEKRIIFLAVTSMICCWICAILMSVHIMAIPMLIFNLQIFCVVFLFNIEICGNINGSIIGNNNNEIHEINEMTQIQLQRQEYMRNAMQRYFQVPQRMVLQTQINIE